MAATLVRIYTFDGIVQLRARCRAARFVDASDFLTTFLQTQFDSGQRTPDVLRQPSVLRSFAALLTEIANEAGVMQ